MRGPSEEDPHRVLGGSFTYARRLPRFISWFSERRKYDNMNNKSEFLNLSELQQKALRSGNWEVLRMYYKPDKIRFVIIGEAPPNGGDRFFYYDEVSCRDYLFLNVMSVLYPDEISEYISNRSPYRKRKLLNKFKDIGGYLMDFYPMPKNVKPMGRDDSYYVEDFLKRFENLGDSICGRDGNINKDNILLIFVHSTAAKLKPIFEKIGFKCFKLPFPLYGHENDFKNRFKTILNDLDGKTQNEKS